MTSSSSSRKIHFDTTEDEHTEHEEEEAEVSVHFHCKKITESKLFLVPQFESDLDVLIRFRVDEFPG